MCDCVSIQPCTCRLPCYNFLVTTVTRFDMSCPHVGELHVVYSGHSSACPLNNLFTEENLPYLLKIKKNGEYIRTKETRGTRKLSEGLALNECTLCKYSMSVVN